MCWFLNWVTLILFTTFEVLVSSYILDSETNFIFFCAFIFIYLVHFIIFSIDIIFFSQILPEKMLDFLDAPVPYIVSYKCTAFSGSSYKCSRILKILFYIWRILRLTFLIIPASQSLFYSGNSGMIWKDICWDLHCSIFVVELHLPLSLISRFW